MIKTIEAIIYLVLAIIAGGMLITYVNSSLSQTTTSPITPKEERGFDPVFVNECDNETIVCVQTRTGEKSVKRCHAKDELLCHHACPCQQQS